MNLNKQEALLASFEKIIDMIQSGKKKGYTGKFLCLI